MEPVTSAAKTLPSPLPTFRFLADTVRAVFDAGSRCAIDAGATAAVDWDLLPRLVRENRVDALFLQGLRHRAAETAVPPVLLDRLREYEAENRRRNSGSDGTLVHLTGALAAAGVDVLVFKGPITARRFYPDAGLRFFWDLDFLVRRRDHATVHALLQANGYRRDGDLGPRERRLFERYHFADCYIPEAPDRPELDVHWTLFPANFPVQFNESDLWDRSEDFHLAEARMRTLSAVDAFVYTAMHGAKEEWRRLQMVADIAAMLTSANAPDLSHCLTRARAWGAQRQFLLALHLAQRLLGVPVPETLTAAIDADPFLPALADDVLVRQARLTDRGSSIFEFSAWRSRSFDTRLARLRYAWRTMSTPRVEHLALVPLPLPLAAFVPVRLVHDHVALPIRGWMRRVMRSSPR